MGKQTKKRTIAAVIALIMAVSGMGVSLSGCSNLFRENAAPAASDDVTPNDEDNNIDGNNDTDEKENDEPLELRHILHKPFDITKADEVQAVADAVEQATNVKVDSLIIKYFNNNNLPEASQLSKDDFEGLTDMEIAEKIVKYGSTIYAAFYDEINKYINLKEAEIKGDEEAAKEIKAEIIDAGKDKNRVTFGSITTSTAYSYTEYEQSFDAIIDEELDDILNGNVSDFEKNASDFGELAKKILSDTRIPAEEKAPMLQCLKAYHQLFEKILEAAMPEENDILKKQISSVVLTAVYTQLLNKLGIILDPSEQDCLARLIEEMDEYVSADAKEANEIYKNIYGGSTGGSSTVTPGRSAKGGSNHHTSSETVSEATTEKKQEKTKEEVTEGTTEIDGNTVEITTDKNGVGHGESTSEGGKVVKEEVSEQEEPTSKISEERFEPGTEEEELFVHLSGLDFNKFLDYFKFVDFDIVLENVATFIKK